MSNKRAIYGIKGEIITDADVEPYLDDGFCLPPLHVVVWEKGQQDVVRFKTDPIYSILEANKLIAELKKYTTLDVTSEPLQDASAIDLTVPQALVLTSDEIDDLRAIHNFTDEESSLAKTMLKVLNYVSPVPVRKRKYTYKFIPTSSENIYIIEFANKKTYSKVTFNTVDEVAIQLLKQGVKFASIKLDEKISTLKK